jgi:hypothetical protein
MMAGPLVVVVVMAWIYWGVGGRGAVKVFAHQQYSISGNQAASMVAERWKTAENSDFL